MKKKVHKATIPRVRSLEHLLYHAIQSSSARGRGEIALAVAQENICGRLQFRKDIHEKREHIALSPNEASPG